MDRFAIPLYALQTIRLGEEIAITKMTRISRHFLFKGVKGVKGVKGIKVAYFLARYDEFGKVFRENHPLG